MGQMRANVRHGTNWADGLFPCSMTLKAFKTHYLTEFTSFQRLNAATEI